MNRFHLGIALERVEERGRNVAEGHSLEDGLVHISHLSRPQSGTELGYFVCCAVDHLVMKHHNVVVWHNGNERSDLHELANGGRRAITKGSRRSTGRRRVEQCGACCAREHGKGDESGETEVCHCDRFVVAESCRVDFVRLRGLWPIDLHTSFATASVQTIVTVYRYVLCVEYASIQYRICLSVNDWATVYEIGICSSALISCSRVKGVQSCFKDPCAMCTGSVVNIPFTLTIVYGHHRVNNDDLQ
jgi:hypothetical protein